MRRRTLFLGALTAALAMVATLAGGCTSSEPVTAIVRIGPAPVEFRVEVAQTAEQQRDATQRLGLAVGGHRDAVPVR